MDITSNLALLVATSVVNIESTRHRAIDASLDRRTIGWTEKWGFNKRRKEKKVDVAVDDDDDDDQQKQKRASSKEEESNKGEKKEEVTARAST